MNHRLIKHSEGSYFYRAYRIEKVRNGAYSAWWVFSPQGMMLDEVAPNTLDDAISLIDSILDSPPHVHVYPL